VTGKITQIGFNELSRKGENQRHDREETSRRNPDKSKDSSQCQLQCQWEIFSL